VALRDIIDIVLEARPAAISFEAANPRHEHEWTVFEDIELPEGKVIIPGVLDSTTNFIEHPELVAQRLVRYGKLVGPENVMAGGDCGFATFASFLTVDPGITWAELHAMAEGAALASNELYRGSVRGVTSRRQPMSTSPSPALRSRLWWKPSPSAGPCPPPSSGWATDVRWATTDPIACSRPRVEWA
jgi:hypothetical protein